MFGVGLLSHTILLRQLFVGFLMAKLRYFIAGLIACLIQGVALSYAPQEKILQVSMDQGINAVQIQLLAQAAAKPIEQTKSHLDDISKQQELERPTEPERPQQDKLKTNASKPKPVVAKKPTLEPAKTETPKPDPLKHQKTVMPKSKPDSHITDVKKIEKSVAKQDIPPAAKPKLKPQENAKKTIEHADEMNAEPHQSAAQNREPMLVSKPQFSAKPVPVSYPRLARKKGLEGKTLIEVWLDREGKQVKQKIISSSGHSILDQRALKTIKQWQFSRRIEQGQAIAHRVQIPINFKLQ